MRADPAIKAPNAQTGFQVLWRQNLLDKAGTLSAGSWRSANPAALALSPENQSFRRCDRSKRPRQQLARQLPVPPVLLLPSNRPSSTRLRLPAPARELAAKILAA